MLAFMEPGTADIPMAIAAAGGAVRDERLVVGSRLATSLAGAHSVEDVAAIAVRQLHDSFDYYLAVVQRLDPDGSLRVVAGAGPLAEEVDDFLAMVQPVEVGVNGRVARSGQPAMINDTRLDSDYLHRNPRTDPGSELSLPIRVAGSVWGVMNLEQEERDAFADEDLLLAHIVAGQVGAAIYRCQLVDELEGAFLTTLGVLADAVELQDAYTADHANEVAELAVRVGKRMGIAGPELDRLRYGALLHDVGKIGVPGELLRKVGPLTPEERQRMDTHTAIGARMLERIPFLAPVAPLVRSAHERVDGGGYPDGLRGDEIPRGAMIIATCDAYHAMTSDRSYRNAMPKEAAIGELHAGAGTQFDPAVVSALVAELG
jgi:putative nucleotidyltransferase with HDIG domain